MSVTILKINTTPGFDSLVIDMAIAWIDPSSDSDVCTDNIKLSIKKMSLSYLQNSENADKFARPRNVINVFFFFFF